MIRRNILSLQKVLTNILIKIQRCNLSLTLEVA